MKALYISLISLLSKLKASVNSWKHFKSNSKLCCLRKSFDMILTSSTIRQPIVKTYIHFVYFLILILSACASWCFQLIVILIAVLRKKEKSKAKCWLCLKLLINTKYENDCAYCVYAVVRTNKAVYGCSCCCHVFAVVVVVVVESRWQIECPAGKSTRQSKSSKRAMQGGGGSHSGGGWKRVKRRLAAKWAQATNANDA